MPTSARRNLHILYKNHADELDAFARRRIGNDEARDVVHDAYLRLMTYADEIPLENPRAYLYRITTNVANDLGAKTKARAECSDHDVEPDTLISPGSGLEEAVLARNTLRRCMTALDELPEAYRHIFLLHRVDGMSQSDIATALDMPKRTVERYIAKALAHCIKKTQA